MPARRKKIPPETMLKLWVLSGGRCEFPSCNELVWRDDLTLKEDNFAHMAHVIAASPAGPRGDKTLSPKLQTDYDNLLLLCSKHSKLIDGRNSEGYTVEQLKDYKIKHEERIRRHTAIGPESATTVVRFQSPIRDRRVYISLPQVHGALYPRFPADDKGVLLDFTQKAGDGDQTFWQEFAREITDQVKQSFRKGNNEQRYEHVSVFALAPIPALVHLGNQIGNIVAVDLYQKHRDTDDWQWKTEPTQDPFEYRYTKTDGADKTKVALVLSLSGKISTDEYRRVLGDTPVYEIEADGVTPEFLKYKSRLQKFRVVYRQALTDIRSKHGDKCVIHLFSAIPAPIAVLCGKELLPKSDPSMLVYDNDRTKGGFVPILTIN
jgi:hypothetical protein